MASKLSKHQRENCREGSVWVRQAIGRLHGEVKKQMIEKRFVTVKNIGNVEDGLVDKTGNSL